MVELGLYQHYSGRFFVDVVCNAYILKRPHDSIDTRRYTYLTDVTLQFNGAGAKLYEARNKNNPKQYLIDPVHKYIEIPYYWLTESSVVYKVPDRPELGLMVRSYTNFTSTSITGKPVFKKVNAMQVNLIEESANYANVA
jgi:hypothetical protein